MIPAMQNYESYDALGLAELVRKRETSAEELLGEALARTEARNPALNAVNMLWADYARAAVRAGLPEGPFHGVPFLLKDLHVQVAGMPLTYGSRLFASYVSETDSELALRYRRAGLVIFGRTASPEFGLTATTESVLWGATRNPWDLARTSGGSSGGASAAVAAGILPAAHASDGGGSIRIPASCCGLFGMKPTRARVPSGPHQGEGWGGMSTAHAVSRSVRDSAALPGRPHGPDEGAPYHAPAPERPYLDEVLREPGRLRVALQLEPWNGAPVDAECRAAAQDAAKLVASLGHEVEEARLEIDAPALARATQVLIGANVQAATEDAAAAQHRALTADDVETVTFGMVQNAKQLGAADYARGVKTIHAVGRAVEAFFGRFDVLLTPTMATQPLPLGAIALSAAPSAEWIARLQQCTGFTQLFNASGHPAMSVPLAWSRDGPPLGAQFARASATRPRCSARPRSSSARPWADRRPQRRDGRAKRRVMPSPVDADHLPGDVRRPVREQECHDRRDLFGLPDAAHRDQLLDLCERQAGKHVGLDQAGRDAVHGDRALGELDRERLGRADEPRLRRAVVDLAAVPDRARDRRDRDDAPALARPHHRHDQRVQHVVEAVEVGAQHRSHASASPGNGASACVPALHTTPERPARGDVGLERALTPRSATSKPSRLAAAAAAIAAHGDGILGRSAVLAVVDRDREAVARQALRDRAADAAARAGDEHAARHGASSGASPLGMKQFRRASASGAPLAASRISQSNETMPVAAPKTRRARTSSACPGENAGTRSVTRREPSTKATRGAAPPVRRSSPARTAMHCDVLEPHPRRDRPRRRNRIAGRDARSADRLVAAMVENAPSSTIAYWRGRYHPRPAASAASSSLPCRSCDSALITRPRARAGSENTVSPRD
jgi:Asp-tRNA(Asn)/Glu-tRNA(Gln) amidotransferase A subunit family amidase